jgi:hypothetical protein
VFTLRRVVITVLLVGASVALVLVFRNSEDGNGLAGGDAVEQLIPGRNAETLSQAEVGVDLADGWEGVLVLNGQELPSADVRTVQALNQILYRPPDGLESGQNCMRAVIWPSAEGRDQSRNVDWCFEVT